MNITISGHQIDSSDFLNDHIHTKANKISDHFEGIINISVILSKVKGSFNAEVNTHYDGKSFSASHKTNDMYHSVTEAFKKLDQQLKTHKSIHLAHRHNASHSEPDSIELATY